jgi:hypothetical protein
MITELKMLQVSIVSARKEAEDMLRSWVGSLLVHCHIIKIPHFYTNRFTAPEDGTFGGPTEVFLKSAY